MRLSICYYPQCLETVTVPIAGKCQHYCEYHNTYRKSLQEFKDETSMIKSEKSGK